MDDEYFEYLLRVNKICIDDKGIRSDFRITWYNRSVTGSAEKLYNAYNLWVEIFPEAAVTLTI